MKRVINRKRLAFEDVVKGKFGEKRLRSSNRRNTGKLTDYYYQYYHHYYQQHEKKCDIETFCCSGFDDSVLLRYGPASLGSRFARFQGELVLMPTLEGNFHIHVHTVTWSPKRQIKTASETTQMSFIYGKFRGNASIVAYVVTQSILSSPRGDHFVADGLNSLAVRVRGSRFW
jgi:hypothetical protein